MANDGYVRLSDFEIAGTGIGTSPKAIAAFSQLQDAAFEANPQAAADAQAAAQGAQSTANSADAKADAAQADATQALSDAAAALTAAQARVLKNVGPVFAAATGTLSRAPYASYAAPTISNPPTQAEVQGVADAVQALSRVVVALVTDLRGNEVLKN